VKRKTIKAVIGKVDKVRGGWIIWLAPDCNTWLTVYHSEVAIAPQSGDIVTCTVPRVLKLERPTP
jgi:hypothetical protein